VSRWRPDARQRLERAAIELFAQQGFAATTVPQITARAGLTTRTFFRHFADKREVLFGGDEISGLAARLMAEAPPSLDPMTLIVGGLKTVAETRFEGRREEFRERRDIIRSDEGLRERDLRKRAAVCEAIREGLISRGVGTATAALVGEISVTVLNVALDEWLDQDGDRTLSEIILDTLASLQTALASFPTGPSVRDHGNAPSGKTTDAQGEPAVPEHS
jgi:AcrR family transcriptional regulator